MNSNDMLAFIANWIYDFHLRVNEDASNITIDDWKTYRCMNELNVLLGKRELEVKRLQAIER